MATLESQYRSYLIQNPDCGYTYEDWMERVMKPFVTDAAEQIEKLKEIPRAIKIAVEFMKRSFGGTEVEIVSKAYRLEPSEDAPAGALGCDVHVKIPGHVMTPVKFFLRNSIAEDMAFNDMGGASEISQMIADEIVFDCIKPEFEKIKEKMNL